MRILKKILIGVVLVLAGLGALAYGIDELVARYRGKPVMDVKVDRFYAARNRWNQVEYSIGTPEMQTCVHAAFPHFGYAPCWYLLKHTTQQVGHP